MKISIVIPAYNEEAVIAHTIEELERRQAGHIKEIIVVDGGSTDKTVEEARKAGAYVTRSSRKGRAAQMNLGAVHAAGEMLYFLHADSIPPVRFDLKILNSCEKGFPAGCFRLAFDDDHPLLKSYAWFTRFDVNAFRFGDQSLYVTKHLFERTEGFDESLLLMEDNEIVRRIKRHAPFVILPRPVITSARKYRRIGVLRLQLIFIIIYSLYRMGASQKTLVRLYQNFMKKTLRNRNN